MVWAISVGGVHDRSGFLATPLGPGALPIRLLFLPTLPLGIGLGVRLFFEPLLGGPE